MSGEQTKLDPLATEDRVRREIEKALPADSKDEYQRLLAIGHNGHYAWCKINHVRDSGCNCGGKPNEG